MQFRLNVGLHGVNFLTRRSEVTVLEWHPVETTAKQDTSIWERIKDDSFNRVILAAVETFSIRFCGD